MDYGKTIKVKLGQPSIVYIQMISSLVRDPSLSLLSLPSQAVRRRLDLGLARPWLDLQLTRPTVRGLASLTRSSEAVIEYSEVREQPNFNIKFSAKLTGVKVHSPARAKVGSWHSS